jgi:hypothetical protein
MTSPSLRSLAITAALLGLAATPARAARVVEVRVGNHPTFTRVVFEFDAPAGYRIERGSGSAQELVLTLDAASTRRQLTSRSPMVAGVEIDAGEMDSVARVRLRRSAPRVKEMILGAPPRIVLDFLLPDAPPPRAVAKPDAPDEVRPESAPESPPAPKPAEEAKPAPKPAAEAKPVPAPAPEAKPAPKPPVAEAKPVLRPPAVEAEPAPKPPVPEAKPAPKTPTPEAKPAPAPEAAKLPPAGEASATPPAAARVESALEGGRIVEPSPARPELPSEIGSRPAPVSPSVPTPEPVAKPPVAAPPLPVAKPAAQPARKPPITELFGIAWNAADPLLTAALVGGVALLALILLVLRTRRVRPTSLDALQSPRDRADAIGAGDSFEGFGTSVAGEEDAGRPSPGTWSAAGSGIFDEEPEKGENGMAMEAAFPVERARESRTQADSGLGETLRDLELRISQLEGRLDQANEARERLERQVGAQSEELRVQRAAIARTQRALRGMTRGAEDQATEPALRDPVKSPPGRV